MATQTRSSMAYAWLGFVGVLALTAATAGPLSAGQEVKIVKDLGLALVELGGGAMAVVTGVGLLAGEIERRTAVSVLAKPVARWEFVVGKYVGLVGAIEVLVAVLGVGLLAVLGVTGGADGRLVVALAMIAGEIALLAAVALFFSSFSSSALVSIVMTVGLFIAGQLSADLRSFGSVADVPGWTASLMSFVGRLLPDFSAFDVKAAIVHGQPVDHRVIGLTLAYGALYAMALVAAAVALFSRREVR
jgi:ABC-type transport system involved in multi-copper enzyme maturation permease subunit